MKRAAWIVAVVALCLAGSAVAQEDRSGGLIGSGTRTDDSGQVLGSGSAAGQTMGSGGFTASTQESGYLGNGGRADSGQVLGSGGFTASPQDSGQYLGSGGRSDTGQVVGSGGLAIRELRLFDGLRLLVVSSGEGTFVVPIAE